MKAILAFAAAAASARPCGERARRWGLRCRATGEEDEDDRADERRERRERPVSAMATPRASRRASSINASTSASSLVAIDRIARARRAWWGGDAHGLCAGDQACPVWSPSGFSPGLLSGAVGVLTKISPLPSRPVTKEIDVPSGDHVDACRVATASSARCRRRS